MTVTALRARLSVRLGKPCTPALLCVTGASGTGKTAAIATLREHLDHATVPVLHFDSFGVPSEEAMHAGWESPRGWQKAMTWHWVQTARNVFRTHPLVVLEGQYDPQYAIAACTANRLRFAIVLLHTDDAIRRERLAMRGQPELDTDEMRSWARYLHESTQQLGGVIVDATVPLATVVDTICAHALSLVDDEEPAASSRTRLTR